MSKEVLLQETPAQISAKLGVPYSASIEILTKCNFDCVHCYIPEHTQEMPTKTVLQIIDQMKELGVFELMLTGGEIFLHKGIMEIISYARSKGLRVTLFSNISLLDNDTVSQLAALYVMEVSTTIFSLDPKVNDAITQRTGSLKRILKSIELLKKYRIPTEIKVPVMQQNKNDYIQIRNFCAENGLKFNYSTAITARTNGDQLPCSFCLEKEDLKNVLRDIEGNATVRKFHGETQVCHAVSNSFHVDVVGNVTPCISFPYTYGNVYSQSLKEIWYSAKERSSLIALQKKDLTDCAECDLRDWCVRCPGLALSEDGTLLGCSHMDRETAIVRKGLWDESAAGKNIQAEIFQ